MEPARRSVTAEGAAFLRALHRHVDGAPPIFDDRAVEALLSAPARRFLQRLDRLSTSWLRTFRRRRSALDSLRAQIVVRARYAEDALAACDPKQYVVLAAGLDTFALRNPNGRLQIFEVDHPATQAWKRTRMRVVPENVLYVPVDFERTTLLEAMAAREFQRSESTFVSWLGTTYYLTRDAIEETLRGLFELTPAGSRVVFDYWTDAPLSLRGDGTLLAGTRLMTALQREPIRSLFAPAEMEALVNSCGWSIREHADATIQNARYLEGRSDGLAVPGFSFLIHLER